MLVNYLFTNLDNASSEKFVSRSAIPKAIAVHLRGLQVAHDGPLGVRGWRCGDSWALMDIAMRPGT
jgi:hypothetical protein